MKLVVTGGAGFIGSHLTRALVARGQVTVVDDLSTGKRAYLQDLPVTFLQGSITNRPFLCQAFQDAECVFHQAAMVTVPGSIRDPIAAHRQNLTGTLNVLLAARDSGVRKVIYASSAAVYGNPTQLPLQEDLLPDPCSPYAVTKAAGELYCQVFSRLYGLETICLRYFNVYGPHQDPASPYAAVIPLFIARVLRGLPPIIHGDGEQTRDFIYVEDVVRANLLAMEQGKRGTFNVAGGKKTSIRELASLIMEILSTDLPLLYESPRSGDVRDSWADISRAEQHLSFHPSFDLRSGLERTIAWFSTLSAQSRP